VSALGTLAWAEATGGRITTRDRVAQLAQGLALQMRTLPVQVAWRLGVAPGRRPTLDPGTIRPPDSTAARRAEEHCREVSSPPLFNHCLRAWLWARILAAQDGLRADDELLYVACLLHDLGLTPRYAAGEPCFAVRGARAAAAATRELGWPVERCTVLAEAITLHLNVRVGREQGIEAHLLNAGTALDVTGLRLWELPAATLAAVVERAPRLGFKQDLWTVWRTETAAHPECRAAFLARGLQLGLLIRLAPFVG
jgi:hypothetical protein